ncbi:hypothetical protein [Priestia megaterium]|uniref:hypothetical protein n=1 Tax=Priestia megaterium TaxID=1404 RepID=UPI00115560DC|nr:hypothetical protein [Priestia megaterium]
MNTTNDQKVMSLAEELRMSSDIIKETAERINFMLKVRKENTVHEHIDQIYSEWEQIAQRLVKGRRMLDQKVEGKRLRDLNNLYNFLLPQLGLYDHFFKSTLSTSHHRALQSSILRILDE